MNGLRYSVLGLGLSLLLTSVSWAEKPKPPEPPVPPLPIPLPPEVQRPLLSPLMLERLKLTEEQKEKVEKLLKDHEAAQKQATAKLRDVMEKAQKEKDPEAVGKFPMLFREFLESTVKRRGEAEKKLRELLTAEQKKTYEELKSQPPFVGPVPPHLLPGMFQPFPGQILAGHFQQMLKLTPEQKEKIDKVQKEAEAKIKEVLTEEQKKQLEDLRKRVGPLPPPPPPPGELPRKE